MLHRRDFLQSAAGMAAAVAAGSRLRAEDQASLPPVRTITRGPLHHWFGYYDKLQFDPTNRYVLSNAVSFEGRTPRADDVVKVGMVDTGDGDRWIELGQTTAWGWQQGCMLQWRPGSQSEIIWNDREGDRYVSRVLDVQTKAKRTLPQPIYSLSPDGRFAITADFARIQVMRPGYGYVGLPDRNGDEVAPADSGVFRVDLGTGETSLILPLAEVAKIPYRGALLKDVWHYFNHLLVSPDSRRFIVLHRWRARDPQTGGPTGPFITRMFTGNVDGSGLYVLDPSGNTSHFIWRDPQHICAWTQPEGRQAAFYLFKDQSDKIEVVDGRQMPVNGHNTYLPLPGSEWILNDTYPLGQQRLQSPYLYHVPSKRRFDLGHFHSPPAYAGEWRCDTHPRSSNDGRTVCIDSPHTGAGRQLHVIDIGGILDSAG